MLAWICFVWSIVDLFGGIVKTLVVEKTVSDRVSSFIVSLFWLLPISFFYMYLFGIK